MIELKNITKSYKNIVLDEFEYKFEQGKIYIIKGVSGCGKTTLLNILGCLDHDYKGDYLLNCKPIKELRKNEVEMFRKGIGYIFQNSLLLSKLTILQNLTFIKNDEETINYYANKLGVTHLLSKYPEQLSGGERQRISIVRALLNNPKLILADEPTASLDHKNSAIIANVMKEISSPENIIVIASHENCFDEVADEIIHLDYGKISSVNKNITTKQITVEKSEEKEKKNRTLIMSYVFQRSKEKYKFLKLLPSIIIMIMLLCCISIQSNLQGEYIKKTFAKYPFNVFSLPNNKYELLKKSYDLVVYDNYTIDQAGVECYPLFEKKNSGLSFPGVIEFGHFPEKNNEIVVSRQYITSYLNTENYRSCIGKTVSIGGYPYIIAGVLSDLSKGDELDLVYYNNYYKIEKPIAVFIPYDTIKERGYKVTSSTKMVRLDSLYDKPEVYEGIRSSLHGAISVWDAKILEMKATIDVIFGIIMAAVCLAGIIAIIFIRNEVQLELFYRRKEIGYLQVFNVSKKRIRLIIVLERLLRTTIALLYAIVVFSICILAVKFIFDINGLIPFQTMLLFLTVILIYSGIAILIPCNKFLKQNIITLIST